MAEPEQKTQTSDSWELHFRKGFDFNGYTNSVKENNPYLTFPGTNFLYLPAKMSLTEVQSRFDDANLKDDFKCLINKVIEQMYNDYKIAFGIINKSDSNYGNAYRSFQGQCDLLTGSLNNFKKGGSRAWITNAGPGESWHNYGYAVDLGVWQWVDTSGNEYGPDWIKGGVFKDADGKVIKNKKNRDYWLAELNKKNSSAAHAIWKMRTQLADVPVYDLEGSEYIHLQMFPKNQSPTNELPAILTTASANQWTYEKADIDVTSFPSHKLRRYKCNFGESKFFIIGTAHQMWTGDATGIVVSPEQVTAGDGETIESAVENKKAELAAKFSQVKTHMEQAQELAKTHEVSPQVYGGYELQYNDKDSKEEKSIWGGLCQWEAGTYVTELQQDLVKLGYWVSTPDSSNGKGMSCDGHLGTNTENAIKCFQLEHFCLDSDKKIDSSKIEMVTGKVDKNTANKIKEQVNKVTGDIKWLRPAHHAQKTWSENGNPKSGDYGEFYQLPPSNGYCRTLGSVNTGEKKLYKWNNYESKCFEIIPDQDSDWIMSDCWGPRDFVLYLKEVAEIWINTLVDNKKVPLLSIGDISGFNGGPLVPHSGHQNGTGVDLHGIMCSTGGNTPFSTIWHRNCALKLAEILKDGANGRGAKRIFFNCHYVIKNVSIVQQLSSHHHHFHVDGPGSSAVIQSDRWTTCHECKIFDICDERIKKVRPLNSTDENVWVDYYQNGRPPEGNESENDTNIKSLYAEPSDGRTEGVVKLSQVQ